MRRKSLKDLLFRALGMNEINFEVDKVDELLLMKLLDMNPCEF